MVQLTARADRYTPHYARIGPPHLDLTLGAASSARLVFGYDSAALEARADRYTPPHVKIGPPHLDIDDAGTSTAYLPFGRRDYAALSTSGEWPIYVDVVLLGVTVPTVPDIVEPPPDHIAVRRLSWGQLNACQTRARLRWADAQRHDQRPRLRWQAGGRHERDARLPWRMRAPRDVDTHLPFAAALPVSGAAALPWRSLAAHDIRAALPWSDFAANGAANDAAAALPWISLRPVDLPPTGLPWEHSQRPSHDDWPTAERYDAAADRGDVDWTSAPRFAELAGSPAPVVPQRSADLDLDEPALDESAEIEFGLAVPRLSAAGRLAMWRESADCDFIAGDSTAAIRWGGGIELTSAGELAPAATVVLSADGPLAILPAEYSRLDRRAWLTAGSGIGLRIGGQRARPVRLRMSNPPAMVVRRPPALISSAAIDIPRLYGEGPPFWRDSISMLQWAIGTPTDQRRRLPWGAGSPRQRDITTPWESEPDEPDPSVIIVPPLRVYNVSNAISVVRLPERTPLHPLAVSASYDDESYAWRVQMTIYSAAEAALLAPAAAPKEVEININGWLLIAAIESYSLDRRYRATTWTATGRSRQVYLDDPYERSRSYVSTGLASAQQLALAELPAGWTLEWEIPDWIVDAGQWSYDKLTPIGAIVRIASAAGALVQPHPSTQTLTVRSRYPDSPDDWSTATPYASVAEDLCTQIGAAYQAQAERNAVIVTGGSQGVTVNATRLGTPGDDPLDTITDSLCTAIELGTERARVELDKTGNRIEQTLALPVMAPLGVVEPGELLEIVEAGGSWRGLVRSTQIAVARTDRGIDVGQTLQLERRV